jgi:hypothetical protein
LKRLDVDELYNVISFLHMVVFKGGKTRIFSDYHYIEFKSYLLKLKVHPSLNHLPETNLSKDDTCTEDHAKNFLVLVTVAILHGREYPGFTPFKYHHVQKREYIVKFINIQSLQTITIT